MPWRPLSHSQRLGRKQQDQAYNRVVRVSAAALAQAQRLRNTTQWRVLRAQVLEEEKWCRNPYGLHRMRMAGTQVDHILSLQERPDLAYARSNLQLLCARCHAHKGQIERRVSHAQTSTR